MVSQEEKDAFAKVMNMMNSSRLLPGPGSLGGLWTGLANLFHDTRYPQRLEERAAAAESSNHPSPEGAESKPTNSGRERGIRWRGAA